MTAREDLITAAKALIANHEQRVAAGDLDRVLENIAQDIVLLAADAPLVVGIDAFRDFYGQLLKQGSWQFGHDYVGAEVVGETVTLYGVANGSLIPAQGEATAFSNNFIITVKTTRNGLKIWRAAFATAGQ